MYISYNPLDIDNKSSGTKRRKLLKSQKQSQALTHSGNEYEFMLRDYFNLKLELKKFYTMWSESDENFKQISKQFPGIRILRQDPVENLFSFICSANNNIPRYCIFLFIVLWKLFLIDITNMSFLLLYF